MHRFFLILLFRRLSAVCSVSFLIASLFVCPTALAQSPTAQLGPMSKRVSRATIEKLGSITQMTDDQREQMLVLYEGYASGHKQLLQEADDQAKVLAEEFRESRAWEEFATKQRTILIKLFDDVRAKRSELLTDIQALLTPEQAAHWPDCERYMRRNDTIRFGFMAGSMVDVVTIAEQVPIQREGSVADVLDQYELAFDPIAKQWLAKLEEFFKVIKAMDVTEQPDEQKLFGMLKEIMELSAKIRNVNRSHAKQLQDVLPADIREAFEQRFLEKSFPVVYEKNFVRRLFEKSLELSDLTQSQKDELATLHESYTRDAALINADWAKEIDRKQEQASADPKSLDRRGDDEAALDAARQARKDLDKRTTERIEKVLNEKQRESATQGLKPDKDVGRNDILPDFDRFMEEDND